MIGAVRVERVCKRFATVLAVDEVSFEIRAGEIFALLGPNGAGKTTLVRMLVGILRPDSGSVRRSIGPDGNDSFHPYQLGYLPEDRGLYRDMKVLPTLEFFGRLRGMPGAGARREAKRWLERFGLADRAAEQLDALSKGNQQKVQFISAVLHGPRLAILDEPFSGLDPVNQELFLGVIRELREAGCTILLSAHQMNLVEQVVDRLLVIDRGREVLGGTMAEIRGRAGGVSQLRFRLEPGQDPQVLAGMPHVQKVLVHDGGEVRVWLSEDASLSELLQAASARLRIARVDSERLTLHEIFLDAVQAGSSVAAGTRDSREESA